MVYCAVVGCKNSTNKGNNFNGSMHSYPADPKLRSTWIAKIKRKNYTWNKHHRVCSDHFCDEDYVLSRTRAAQIGFYPGIYQLQNWAVPTLKLSDNNPCPLKKPRKSLASIKRQNLETIKSYEMQANNAASAESEASPQAVIEGSIFITDFESAVATHKDIGTQAFVQVR